jgi:hypothetical protein
VENPALINKTKNLEEEKISLAQNIGIIRKKVGVNRMKTIEELRKKLG